MSKRLAATVRRRCAQAFPSTGMLYTLSAATARIANRLTTALFADGFPIAGDPRLLVDGNLNHGRIGDDLRARHAQRAAFLASTVLS